jgi:hypothetical protein
MAFVLSPVQSAILVGAHVNPPPPITILESQNVGTMILRKRRGREYSDEVKFKKKRSEAIQEDVDAAFQYRIETVIIDKITDIAPACNQLNNAGLALQLTAITNELIALRQGQAALQRGLAARRIISFNHSASHETDIITPPHEGVDPPPANFPRTVLTLNGANLARLQAMEAYYHVAPVEANIKRRRETIKRIYGVGVTTKSGRVLDD